MDITLVRSIITLLCFLAFLAIVFWAYSSRNRDRFTDAANLPFADDEMQQRTLNATTVASTEGPIKEESHRG